MGDLKIKQEALSKLVGMGRDQVVFTLTRRTLQKTLQQGCMILGELQPGLEYAGLVLSDRMFG